MHRPRIRPRTPVAAAVGTAAVGAASFATIAALVAKRRTRRVDRAVRKRVGTGHESGRVGSVVKVLGYTGKQWVHGPVAALIASYVGKRGSLEGSRAVNFASALATATSSTFDWVLKHEAPPPGRHKPEEQSFPSGHTLETAAVALTSAYILWREGIADPRVAFPLALAVPVLEGGGRLYLDRHWLSDVVAGLVGGVTVAAICAAGYEARTEGDGY